jgi:hypothetical protein
MVRRRKANVMTEKNKAKTTGARPEKLETPVRKPAVTRPAKRAQPSGFSREEMRQIVVEMIG